MTGSFTRSLRSWGSAVLLATLLALPPTPGAAQARGFGLAALTADDGSYVLEADIDFNLNPRLEDAVERGVALYLVLEIEVTRNRWYWLDERIIRRKRTHRLSYHPLTRTYRLTLGSLHQSFDTLDEALQPIRHVRNWSIMPRDRLQPGASYDVGLRFRLDTSQLPKPFQVTALGSDDWHLETEWLRWTFLATAGP